MPSNVSLRREFSLTSYESDIFDPEEIYRHLRDEMSVTRTPSEHAAANATTDADHDIPLQVARQLEQQIAQGLNRRAPRREDTENYAALLELLREMRVEVRSLSERMTRMVDSNRNINRQGTNEAERI